MTDRAWGGHEVLYRISLLVLSLCFVSGAARSQASLSIGWYAAAPFQTQGPAGLTGLDIEMVRAIAARAGHGLAFSRVLYPELMREVASGRRDLVSGVAWTAQRAAAGRMSRAYRQDVNVLIQRRDGLHPLAKDASGLLAHLKVTGFRIGVIEGYSYGDPVLDAWLADPARGAQVRRSGDDAANLRLLLAGEIDGFLAERLTAAALVAAQADPRAVEENGYLRLSIPLHLMFSREVPAATVAAFDAAIASLQADGTLYAIAARFRAPVLLGLTLNSRWFFVLEVIGTLAAALAGYLAARAGRYSLFGGLVLALTTAVGGGILRDLLVARHPIGVMSSPIYLQMVLGTVLLAYLVGRLNATVPRLTAITAGGVWRERLFDLADAIGLAAFTVVGVAVAVGVGATPLWLWGPLLGAITGAGGGIIRDIIRGGGDVPNLKTGFYGEVAVLWAIVLSAWLEWRSAVIEREEVLLAVVVTVAGGVITRMALLRMRAPGLP
ncbi:MAG: transporter substrate-binding domain-containing protein [Roseococcus sp.]|nr:transporter substrate-binding domain-containing protein [Roseococcus sp.]